MWILIDNYDSFTYILHHYLLLAGGECKVVRNDEVSLEELQAMNPSRIIISPGPETPIQAGICMDTIKHYHDKIPILGVCLGHQALAMHFGAKLIHAPQPMHGKTSNINHNGHELFKDIPNGFKAMRYHSLAIEGFEGTKLKPIATSEDDGVNMAFAHEDFMCIAVQFHPESVGTNDGHTIIKNWANMFL